MKRIHVLTFFILQRYKNGGFAGGLTFATICGATFPLIFVLCRRSHFCHNMRGHLPSHICSLQAVSLLPQYAGPPSLSYLFFSDRSQGRHSNYSVIIYNIRDFFFIKRALCKSARIKRVGGLVINFKLITKT